MADAGTARSDIKSSFMRWKFLSFNGDKNLTNGKTVNQQATSSTLIKRFREKPLVRVVQDLTRGQKVKLAFRIIADLWAWEGWSVEPALHITEFHGSVWKCHPRKHKLKWKWNRGKKTLSSGLTWVYLRSSLLLTKWMTYLRRQVIELLIRKWW